MENSKVISKKDALLDKLLLIKHLSNILKEISKMIRLEMYNVGHGDCYYIHDMDNTLGMLIDCGGGNDVFNKAAFKQLNTDISNNYKDLNRVLVISHFHADHYGKLKKLKAIKFSDVFAPNFIFPFNIEEMVIILIALSSRSRAYKIALHYLNLIPNIKDYLDSARSIIHFVGKKYQLNNKLGTYNVLWPDCSLTTKSHIISIDELQLNDELKKLANAVLSDFKHLYETSKVIADGFDRYITGEVIVESANLIQSSVKKLTEYLKKNKVNIVADESIKEKLRKKMNEVSLILYEKEKGVLFTGDITPDIYDAHVAKEVLPKIHILKTPHHGSFSHYTDMLPESDFSLINEKKSSKYVCWKYATPSKYGDLFCFDDGLSSTCPAIVVNVKQTFFI